MKILFIMRHSGFVRNFESTLRLLCERGHRVHVGFIVTKERHWMEDSADLAQQLSAENATFSSGLVPVREDSWGLLGATLRASTDYLRYLTPGTGKPRSCANVQPKMRCLPSSASHNAGHSERVLVARS